MLRFASSPTGDMHIGNLRVAILNYLISQQRHESFTIRIDDTDTTRNIEGKDTEIMQILEKFALTHESVFHQSEHLHMHQTLAIRLLEEGKAFVCTCSDKELQTGTYSGHCFDIDKMELAKLKESGTPFSIRIKKPTEQIITHDIIQGDIGTEPNKVDSFIILDINGIPTYNFASACDDMLSAVTTIIGEEGQLLDTARQEHIKAQLGYDHETSYAHLPSILNTSGEKSSNEYDVLSLKWMFKEGFVPDAIINYLLLLGNTEVPKEIFTLPEAIESFKLENISKTAVEFDIEKLRFINREHLKRIEDIPFSALFGFADADIGKLAKLYLEECSTTKGIQTKIDAIFSPKVLCEPYGEQMSILAELIQDAPMFSTFDAFNTHLMKTSGLKGENYMNPLRYLLTGTDTGPELSELFPLINPYLLEIATCTPSSTL